MKYKEVIPDNITRNGYERITWSDKEIWYQKDGRIHRVDGPAIERIVGNKEWWLDGKRQYKGDFQKNPKMIVKMKAWELFEPEELVRLKKC